MARNKFLFSVHFVVCALFYDLSYGNCFCAYRRLETHNNDTNFGIFASIVAHHFEYQATYLGQEKNLIT